MGEKLHQNYNIVYETYMKYILNYKAKTISDIVALKYNGGASKLIKLVKFFRSE